MATELPAEPNSVHQGHTTSNSFPPPPRATAEEGAGASATTPASLTILASAPAIVAAPGIVAETAIAAARATQATAEAAAAAAAAQPAKPVAPLAKAGLRLFATHPHQRPRTTAASGAAKASAAVATATAPPLIVSPNRLIRLARPAAAAATAVGTLAAAKTQGALATKPSVGAVAGATNAEASPVRGASAGGRRGARVATATRPKSTAETKAAAAAGAPQPPAAAVPTPVPKSDLEILAQLEAEVGHFGKPSFTVKRLGEEKSGWEVAAAKRVLAGGLNFSYSLLYQRLACTVRNSKASALAGRVANWKWCCKHRPDTVDLASKTVGDMHLVVATVDDVQCARWAPPDTHTPLSAPFRFKLDGISFWCVRMRGQHCDYETYVYEKNVPPELTATLPPYCEPFDYHDDAAP